MKTLRLSWTPPTEREDDTPLPEDDIKGYDLWMTVNPDVGYDPIESLMISCVEIQRAAVQARLVDRASLARYQNDNDALMSAATLRKAFRTDVDPILAMARKLDGGAIDPIQAYRAAGYRAKVAAERPHSEKAGSSGIV